MPRRKIIIDTDPGVDDAMAIHFALQSPEIDVIGLTTVFGNVYAEMATTNALRLLEIAGRIDIPVAKGADHPIAGDFSDPVTFIHGDDGQGNVHLPPPQTKQAPETAAQFIIDQVMTFPGEVTLVPIAPLTNLALALRLEPRIADNVAEIVLMGGNALCPGNITPAAEANVYNDAEAADVVFGARWPITMIGLDVTEKAIMTPDHLAEYSKAKGSLVKYLAQMMPFYSDFHATRYTVQGMFTHDPSTIAYLVDPTLFTTRKAPIRVETQGISRGKTWPAFGDHILPPWKDRRSVNIALDVDVERLLALILSRL